MGRRCLPTQAGIWLASLKKEQEDWQQIVQSLGILYEQGVEVNWCGFDRDYQRHRLTLPTYPFERQRYWKEAVMLNQFDSQRASQMLPHPLPDQQPASGLQAIKSEFQIAQLADHSRLSKQKLLVAEDKERQLMLETYMLEILAKALQLPISKLKPQHLLTSLLDSLIMIELKKQIETDLHITIPTVKFYEELSIGQFAAFLLEQLNPASLLEQLTPDSLNLCSILKYVDEETLVQMLNEVEGLSEAEAQNIFQLETQEV
jgi:acyl transferase domain-containing protein